ncbi:MAG: hypothetical protein GY749_27680 [Desulfobacteraceae bacterium]|nr:hypothetical protein [Desulfobacteraceae bacterium]
MKIGTIVEGPTDRLMLKAIIDKIFPEEHSYLDLQPTGNGASFGTTGTGWKGVRRFCFDLRQYLNTNIADFITDHQLDLLIIHVDADIALESDLQENLMNPVENVNQPCPPITPTIAKLQEVVARWLNLDSASQFPSQVIISIPSQDTENWLFAALFPDDELCRHNDYECIQNNSRKHPAYLLTLKNYNKILKRKNGEIKKSKKNYQKVLENLIKNWDKVCEICSQAKAFNDKLNIKQFIRS